MSRRHDLSNAARLLLAGIACLALGTTALADELAITGLRVGFAGKYKLGYWTPAEVTLQTGNEPTLPALSLVVPDGDGVLSRVQLDSGTSPVPTPGDAVPYRGFVKFGQTDDRLQIEIRDGSKPQVTQTLRQGSDQLGSPLPVGQELIVIVGQPAGDGEAAAADDRDWRAEVARVSNVEELPDEWFGYEGVDRLVLLTDQPEIYGPLQGRRLAALDQWVRLGGRLMLCVGSQAAKVLAAEQPLARFAPGKFDQMMSLRQSSALETFAGTSDRLDRSSGREAFRLDVPKLLDVRGRIEAYEGNHPRDLPLVVRSPYGLGEVLLVGLDLDRPPTRGWHGRGALIDRLLARPEVAEASTDAHALGRVTALGYTDLVGQLHLGLSQFAGVALIPFAAVAVLLAAYIVCIGPIDYLFLKKIVRRMEWTWLTFPAIVLVFSGGTYAVAHWLKGSQLRINQVDLIDVDADTNLARGTSWSTLYSPKIDTFDLSLQTDPSEISPTEKPRVLLSWMSAGGSGLSGAGRAAGSAMFTHPYDFSRRLDAIEHLPIATWSTRSLVVRWWAQAPSPIVAELTDRGDHFLSGKLTLPAVWPLKNCVLVYDRWAYPLTVAAGDTIDVDRQLEPQTAETYFRHVTTFDEKLNRPTYDRSTIDLARITETMMFHDLIGGEVYTQLSGHAQNYVDFSNLIRLGRAVLVGQSPEPATTLLRGGQASEGDTAAAPARLVDPAGERLTFYRFVLPVAVRVAD